MKLGVENIPIGTVFKIRRPTVAIAKKYGMDVQKGEALHRDLGLSRIGIGRPYTKGKYISINGTKIANVWFDCLAIYLDSNVLNGSAQNRVIPERDGEKEYFTGLDYAVVYILKKPRLKNETKNSGVCTIIPTALLKKHDRIIDIRLIPNKGSFPDKKFALHGNPALYCLAQNVNLSRLSTKEREVSNIVSMSRRNTPVINKKSYKSRLQHTIWSKMLRSGRPPITLNPRLSPHTVKTTSASLAACCCPACGFYMRCSAVVAQARRVKGKKEPRFKCLGCRTTYKIKMGDDDVEITSEDNKHKFLFPGEPASETARPNNTENTAHLTNTVAAALQAERRLERIQARINTIMEVGGLAEQ